MSKQNNNFWFAKPLAISCLLLGCLSSPVLAATVLIDFGNSANQTVTDGSGRTWNNYTNATTTSLALTATTNTSSGWTLNVPSGTFSSSNDFGVNTLTGAAATRGYPTSASRDAAYKESPVLNTPYTMTLTGLSQSESYNFTLYANRANSSGNREAEYTVSGANGSFSGVLNPINNYSNILQFASVTPNLSGEITISYKKTANNDNNFIYFSVIEIESNPVPEPASIAILGLGGVGFIAMSWRRRRARMSRG